jgi:hypothetical protein
MPRDACFYTNTCSSAGSISWGNGSWTGTAAADAYKTKHHGGVWPAGVTTRYSLYLKELAMSPAPAEMTPHCAAQRQVAGVGGPERRIIYVALADCVANGIKGNYGIGFTPKKFAKFFLTEPGQSDGGSTNGEIWAEFVEMLTVGNDSGKLHHVVQLYE